MAWKSKTAVVLKRSLKPSIQHRRGIQRHSPMTSEESAPLESRQKGRAAQKRYRDKQKARREGMEDQVAVLTRRIAEMQAAHDSLQNRNKSLERWVELAEDREDTATSQSQEDTDVFGDSNVDKEWRKVFAQGVNEMRGLNAAPISPDQCDIRALDPKRLMSLKQESCRILCKWFGDSMLPSEEAKANIIQHIITLRKNRLRLMGFMTLPRRAHQICSSMLPGSNQFQMQPFLPSLVQKIEMSPDQKFLLLRAKQKFQEDSAILRLERNEILQELRVDDVQDTNSFVALSGALHDAANAQIRLSENLQAEGVCMRHFAIAFMEAVTPWQEAVLLAEAYQKYNTVVELWDVANVLELEQRTEFLHTPSNLSQASEDMQNLPFLSNPPAITSLMC